MQKKLKLKKEYINYLVSQPEQGMGYQVVEVRLINGDVLKDRLVTNSTFLLLEENENILAENIAEVVIQKVK